MQSTAHTKCETSKIDLYSVTETLAQGGQAKVVRAQNAKGKILAIKVWPHHTKKGGSELATPDSIRVECELYKKLKHRSVIKTYEHKSSGKWTKGIHSSSVAYLVMELMQCDMAFLIKLKPFPEPICRHFFGQMIDVI